MEQFIAEKKEYIRYNFRKLLFFLRERENVSGNFKLTKMINNITLKMATTRHSVFMYCATPALEGKVSRKHLHSEISDKVTYFEVMTGDGQLTCKNYSHST